jgi:hypothetical protein
VLLNARVRRFKLKGCSNAHVLLYSYSWKDTNENGNGGTNCEANINNMMATSPIDFQNGTDGTVRIIDRSFIVVRAGIILLYANRSFQTTVQNNNKNMVIFQTASSQGNEHEAMLSMVLSLRLR